MINEFRIIMSTPLAPGTFVMLTEDALDLRATWGSESVFTVWFQAAGEMREVAPGEHRFSRDYYIRSTHRGRSVMVNERYLVPISYAAGKGQAFLFNEQVRAILPLFVEFAEELGIDLHAAGAADKVQHALTQFKPRIDCG